MPGPQTSRTPSRASSSGSLRASPGVGGATSAQLEALIGASRAFGRPQPPSKSVPTSDGAATHQVLAASTATGSKTPSPRSVNHASKRLSPAGGGTSRPLPGIVVSKTGGTLVLDHKNLPKLTATPQQENGIHAQYAAQVAAMPSPQNSIRHETTPTRLPAGKTSKPAVMPKPRPLSVMGDGQDKDGLSRVTDTSSIAPTTSLVELFEHTAKKSVSTGDRPDPIVIKPSPDLPMRSPKPVRTSDGGITQLFKLQLEDQQRKPKAAVKSFGGTDVTSDLPKDVRSPASDDAYISAPENPSIPKSSIVIQKRTTRADKKLPAMSVESPVPIDDRIRLTPATGRAVYTGSADVSYSSKPISPNSQWLSVSTQSGKSIPAQYNQLYPRRLTPLNTGDDLANAIVASSLASARAPSPRKPEPPPPPTRRHKSHNRLSFSRTPSPAKQGMLHTLRKIDSSESEDEDEHHRYGRHKKNRLVRKHPNKHHEGDRKRWREVVTERERKRYEGVWAANKGLHITFTSEEENQFRVAPNSDATLGRKVAIHEYVSNIVTKEVWSRSRLPETVLETVWDLVDNECTGRLSKVEFVVGLWLIDQRLKGSKLPVKVTDSVWASVRTLQGIKIKK